MECPTVMQQHRIQGPPIRYENTLLIGLISSTDILMAVDDVGWEVGQGE